MVIVTGPRIDPASIAAPEGVEVHGFLPDLDLHHASCDIAVVQGGLSTTMELTASGRPFLYFPLGHHFEQQIHVRHRLERHGAGRCMDYRDADPSRIAAALVGELRRPVSYVPVPTDGASPRRSARRRADLTSCASTRSRTGVQELSTAVRRGARARAAPSKSSRSSAARATWR